MSQESCAEGQPPPPAAAPNPGPSAASRHRRGPIHPANMCWPLQPAASRRRTSGDSVVNSWTCLVSGCTPKAANDHDQRPRIVSRDEPWSCGECSRPAGRGHVAFQPQFFDRDVARSQRLPGNIKRRPGRASHGLNRSSRGLPAGFAWRKFLRAEAPRTNPTDSPYEAGSWNP